MCLFITCLPFESALRVWDVMLLDGATRGSCSRCRSSAALPLPAPRGAAPRRHRTRPAAAGAHLAADRTRAAAAAAARRFGRQVCVGCARRRPAARADRPLRAAHTRFVGQSCCCARRRWAPPPRARGNPSVRPHPARAFLWIPPRHRAAIALPCIAHRGASRRVVGRAGRRCTLGRLVRLGPTAHEPRRPRAGGATSDGALSRQRQRGPTGGEVSKTRPRCAHSPPVAVPRALLAHPASSPGLQFARSRAGGAAECDAVRPAQRAPLEPLAHGHAAGRHALRRKHGSRKGDAWGQLLTLAVMDRPHGWVLEVGVSMSRPSCGVDVARRY